MFKPITARLLSLALLGLGISPNASHAAPAAYPDRPIRLVVPYPAGGAADTVARTLAAPLGAKLGQTIVVDNRPGASGVIGAGAVAKAAPDGYTLLLDATAHSVNPSLQARLPYDTVKDFAPISLVVLVPNLLVVPPNSPFTSPKDIVNAAKAKPGKLTYASAGPGTAQHLAAELFRQQSGLNLLHVPYKGGAPALSDLMGGQVDMMFSNMAASYPLVAGKKLKVLATTGTKRSAALPDTPTIAESGLPGYQVYEWNGLFAPAGTPQAIVDRLSALTREVLNSPEVSKRLAAIGAEPAGSRPEDFRKFVEGETAKWAKVIKQGSIRAE
ncbi:MULTISPECIES: tripartite tricarboxylate transporter substrate binding protein [Cupriavidus]|uniref:Tripartite tricarboxylate transporter substrate binding protein n=1 Tax=Cupriavidus oxalaticus TaxID=96344 RepID=A0A4P7LHX5_9BURK|nr:MULTISPECIES: tripartite tricarboxylate transporter substrate binding protein [Cupriavidus]MBF6989029.1 tripartite tricarboxylate transporter substrate binding protein [Cupriavidus sp. IK-TO18]QBY55248.1 tripartite tricarboxylate transporter substrate binding protein [Cupriavidus oxalaticus]TDF65078.1 tripartite tricarboxylate transporter substrate binding protein [Cupriavidus sp. L7L]